MLGHRRPLRHPLRPRPRHQVPLPSIDRERIPLSVAPGRGLVDRRRTFQWHYRRLPLAAEAGVLYHGLTRDFLECHPQVLLQIHLGLGTHPGRHQSARARLLLPVNPDVCLRRGTSVYQIPQITLVVPHPYRRHQLHISSLSPTLADRPRGIPLHCQALCPRPSSDRSRSATSLNPSWSVRPRI